MELLPSLLSGLKPISRFDCRRERRSGSSHPLSAIIGMLSAFRRNPHLVAEIRCTALVGVWQLPTPRIYHGAAHAHITWLTARTAAADRRVKLVITPQHPETPDPSTARCVMVE